MIAESICRDIMMVICLRILIYRRRYLSLIIVSEMTTIEHLSYKSMHFDLLDIRI